MTESGQEQILTSGKADIYINDTILFKTVLPNDTGILIFELPCNNLYKLTFRYPGYVPMSCLYSIKDLPHNAPKIIPYLNIMFMNKANNSVDASLLEIPVIKYFYDPKQKAIVHDKEYFRITSAALRTFGQLEAKARIEQDQRAALFKLQAEKRISEKERELGEYKRYFLIAIILSVCLISAWLINWQKIKIRTQRESHLMEQNLLEERLARNMLEKQNKEEKLNNYTLLLQEKTKLLEEMSATLKLYEDKNSEALSAEQLLEKVKDSMDAEQYWEEFIASFNLVYKDFLEKLASKYPDLTRNEIRLSILIKCNLGNKEIANVLHISAEAVKKAHHRIRKKFNLEAGDNLRKFIQQLS